VLHSITLVPTKYFDLLLEKKVWNWHSSASEFAKSLGLHKDANINDYIDLFINSVHWSSSEIEWNPLFVQCGRTNKLTYEQCAQVQERIPLSEWVYASNGLFYDNEKKIKYIVENCNYYDILRLNEFLENPDLDKFYT
jgi:hypothetical protein